MPSSFYKTLGESDGQLTSALNNKPLGKLSSDTQVPIMEDIKEFKVVELRNAKDLPTFYKLIERGGNDKTEVKVWKRKTKMDG